MTCAFSTVYFEKVNKKVVIIPGEADWNLSWAHFFSVRLFRLGLGSTLDDPDLFLDLREVDRDLDRDLRPVFRSPRDPDRSLDLDRFEERFLDLDLDRL